MIFGIFGASNNTAYALQEVPPVHNDGLSSGNTRVTIPENTENPVMLAQLDFGRLANQKLDAPGKKILPQTLPLKKPVIQPPSAWTSLRLNKGREDIINDLNLIKKNLEDIKRQGYSIPNLATINDALSFIDSKISNVLPSDYVKILSTIGYILTQAKLLKEVLNKQRANTSNTAKNPVEELGTTIINNLNLQLNYTYVNEILHGLKTLKNILVPNKQLVIPSQPQNYNPVLVSNLYSLSSLVDQLGAGLAKYSKTPSLQIELNKLQNYITKIDVNTISKKALDDLNYNIKVLNTKLNIVLSKSTIVSLDRYDADKNINEGLTDLIEATTQLNTQFASILNPDSITALIKK